MFGLSTIWLRVIGAAVIAALVGGVLWGTYAKGYATRDTEAKLEMSQALLRAHKKTDELQVEFDGLKSKVLKERKNAETRIAGLNAALLAGELRLSIPAPAQPGAASAGPGAPEARTELDRATSASLVAITADGDAAIRDLNQCVDSYNALKEKLNGNRPH